MGWIGSAGAWLNALEAQMRVHAVNRRRYDRNEQNDEKNLDNIRERD